MTLGRAIRPTFLVLVLVLSGVPAEVQGQTGGNFYSRPYEVKLERATRRNFAGYRKLRPGEAFMIDGFFPIGWSKDGKFAYYLEPVDEACGCYFAKLQILDLKTDKVLWSFDYDGAFNDDPKKEGKPQNLVALWRANRRLFSDKLREHGIQALRRFALLSFPVIHKGDRLAATITTKEKPGLTEEERWYGTVGQAIVQLNSTRNGTKTILEESYVEVLPLFVGMVGYIKSPFESRIGVVLISIQRGYEGPPHVGEVKIVGANLETGFK